MEISGAIFDIKRFAVHYGPGVRTTVFLKGCLLSCAWCHNPEGIRRQAEMVYFENRCIHCGACVEACPNQAREIIAGEMVYHRERCEMCAKCLDAFVTLIRTFFACGGYALQFNVFDVETLRDAQRNPEKYASMQIRVTGWSVYFTYLLPEEQELFIQRTAHGM